MKRKINVSIRCSKCGTVVPYDFDEFINVKDEPVCNRCFEGCSNTMTNYLNKLKESAIQENKTNKFEADVRYVNAGITRTENVPWNKLYYPKINEAKQIELIKWLSKKYGLRLSGYKDFNIMAIESRIGYAAPDFDKCIFGLINAHWEKLTQKEREEIKEILK